MFYFDCVLAGYHEVLRVPAQSRHIRVSEQRECPASFLSLRGALNGHWVLDWPGRYRAAGATFSYRRWPGQPESLVAKGPTTEELVVEVIALFFKEWFVGCGFIYLL